MRITGGRDYYDSALRFGHDDHTIFVRSTDRLLNDKAIPCPVLPIRATFKADKSVSYRQLAGYYDDLLHARHAYGFARIVVIFCGRIHWGMTVEDTPQDGTPHNKFFWYRDKFDEWLAERDLAIEPGRGYRDPMHATLDRLFDETVATGALLDWLVLNKVVVAIRFPQRRWIAHEMFWEVNSPRLKDVHFYRKIDAYQAFQEIDMWISGVLPTDAPQTVKVDDTTRIAKHGFDQSSFRKPKQS